MKPKTLLVLAVLAAALALFIVFVERDLPSTDERREQDQKILGGVETEAIVAVALSGGDLDEPIRLEAAPSDSTPADDDVAALGDARAWRLAAPTDAPADGAAVDAFLARLVELEKSRTLEAIDRAQLGLDEARVEITLELADGTTRQLHVGSDLPLGGGTILGGDDPTVAWATNLGDLPDQMLRTPDDWRDKRLVSIPQDRVQRLVIADLSHDEPRRTVVTRVSDHRFDLEEPLQDSADTEAVRSLLGSLAALVADTFLEAESAPEDFAPTRSLEIQSSHAADPWRLVWQPATGGAATTARARVTAPGEPERWVELDTTTLDDAVTRDPESWRSRGWLPLQVFEIDRALIEIGDQAPIELVRESGQWHRDGEPIDYTLASDSLYPLSEARAEGFLDRRAAIARGYDLDRPLLRAVLTTDDRQQTVELFDTVDGLAAATVDGRETVLLLPATSATTVLGAAEALRDAAPSGDTSDS